MVAVVVGVRAGVGMTIGEDVVNGAGSVSTAGAVVAAANSSVWLAAGPLISLPSVAGISGSRLESAG